LEQALKKMKKQSAGIGKYLTAAQTSTSTLARAYRSHRSATAEDLQAWQVPYIYPYAFYTSTPTVYCILVAFDVRRMG
jgi:hypothetical protein